ncbi:MAG: AI-2E family transporter [Anaerolineales bacterium]
MSEKSNTPRWNTATKLVIGFTLVAIAAGLVIRFNNLLPPLILALLLVYLLYPAAAFLNRRARLQWGLAVGLVYLLLIVLFFGLGALGGLELIQQIQSLVKMIESSLTELPALTARLTSLSWQFGPFTLDFASLDLNQLSAQAIDWARSLLGRTGELLGNLAGSALGTLGWSAFVLLISYFMLAESGGLRGKILHIELPGYGPDLDRMGQELSRVWNAFLRGQLILVSLAIVIYTLVLSLLGVRYAFGLALLAGLARFLPYVGPAISWTTLALVTFFQPDKPFGWTPLVYTLVVLVIAWLIDGILDNLVSPRIMAEALKVHPAAVMISALIAANLLGLLGVVIAAPMLATLQLIFSYVVRKLFDLDPWQGLAESSAPPPLRQQIKEMFAHLKTFLAGIKKPKESR